MGAHPEPGTAAAQRVLDEATAGGMNVLHGTLGTTNAEPAGMSRDIKLCIDCKHIRSEDFHFPDRLSGPFCAVERATNLVTGKPEPLRTCEEQRYVRSSLVGCGQEGTQFRAKEANAS